MSILLTGATGYVGNRLAHRLLEQGQAVNLLVRDPGAVNLPAAKNIQIFKGDIRDAGTVALAMHGCTHVYHCAAIARLSASVKDVFYDINVTGTKIILEAAINANIQKLVFTSSAAVFGPSLNIPLTENDPRIESFESDYDFSKHLAENLVREFVKRGLNAVIVNPSRVYGPGLETYSNWLMRMIRQLASKRMVFFPGISGYRTNFCYIDDIVGGHILAMDKGKPGENYILGGENVSYGELLGTLKEQLTVNGRIVTIPVSLAKAIASLSCLLNQNTELTPSLITRFAKNRMLNSNKAIESLGYHVTPFREGLQHTIDFIKNTRS